MPDLKVFYQDEEITEKHRKIFSGYCGEIADDMEVLNGVIEAVLGLDDTDLREQMKTALWYGKAYNKDASYYKLILVIRAVRRNKGRLQHSVGGSLRDLGISALYLFHSYLRSVLFIALIAAVLYALLWMVLPHSP